MKDIKWLRTPGFITFVFKGKSSTLATNTEKCKQADVLIKAGKEEELIDLIYTTNRIEKITKGEFKVDTTEKTITKTKNNERLHPVLAKKLVNFSFKHQHYNAFKKFLKNVKLNPNQKSVEQLYHFLEHNHFPITPDGCFLAYKSVARKNGKLVDHHTGTFDNSIGQTVKMPREKCDARRDVTCSHGLHVAAYSYAHSFNANATIIEVKVNPKDVVSVPNDYNNQKMRVCEYYVIKEGPKEIQHSYLSQKYIAGKVDVEKNGKPISTVDESMTAREIIDFIKEKTGFLIAISLKSKKSIIQKANKILAELREK